MKTTVIFTLVLLFLFMVSFTGCGRKTAPVYKEKVSIGVHPEIGNFQMELSAVSDQESANSFI